MDAKMVSMSFHNLSRPMRCARKGIRQIDLLTNLLILPTRRNRIIFAAAIDARSVNFVRSGLEFWSDASTAPAPPSTRLHSDARGLIPRFGHD